MTDRINEMLSWHADHNHSEEIRAHCREMLAEIEPPPAHRSQTILQTPEQRAAYLQALSRSLDGSPVDASEAEGDPSFVMVWAVGGIAIGLTALAAALYRWFA